MADAWAGGSRRRQFWRWVSSRLRDGGPTRGSGRTRRCGRRWSLRHARDRRRPRQRTISPTESRRGSPFAGCDSTHCRSPTSSSAHVDARPVALERDARWGFVRRDWWGWWSLSGCSSARCGEPVLFDRWSGSKPSAAIDVVDAGPYAVVRHPGYAGMILAMPFSALALGSWPSLAIALVYPALFFDASSSKIAYLHANLPGYTEYARRVPLPADSRRLVTTRSAADEPPAVEAPSSAEHEPHSFGIDAVLLDEDPR